ncbi:MAG TPA: MauE/DoxX family redox-associated membrane protein [Candidatus Methylomirabilis sp.]|nr:MauE/DoxX family redox-associated membrane protein [Candidatus Methylomirabilis sp.]
MATTEIPLQTSVRPAAWPRILLLIGRVALGSIFLISAYTKLHFNGSWHLGDYHFFFAMAVDSYNMLPLWAVEIVARVLPILEAVLGAFLVSGVGLRWVASITSALILVFIAAMTRALILHIQIKCGCFGNDDPLTIWTLLRDSSFLVLALAVTIGAFLLHRPRNTPSS